MTYSFPKQLKKGQKWESQLDSYFGRWYDIKPAYMEEQRQGIDRKFTPKNSKAAQIMTVEYKADELTQKTGNVFIETHSVLNEFVTTLGWGWTSKAYMLIYWAIPDTIYIVPMLKVREHMPEWEQKYGVRLVPNKGYQSAGIPVPKGVFSSICSKVRRMK